MRKNRPVRRNHRCVIEPLETRLLLAAQIVADGRALRGLLNRFGAFSGSILNSGQTHPVAARMLRTRMRL